jgi:formylglycine-generating enzyme required for sulfatase activity
MRWRVVVALLVTTSPLACSLAFPTHEASEETSSSGGTSDSSLPPVEASDGPSRSDVDGASGARSCAGLPNNCGANHDRSCCDAADIPGGSFQRSYDGATYATQNAPATVGPFRLDTYEVTVGRFRAFLADYRKPDDRSGRNPRNGADPGWRSADYNPHLPDAADAGVIDDLKACTGGNPAQATWTDTTGGGDSRAVNCVTWFLAYAFCIWDGGRLPTEAEWNFAAAGGGGTEQRPYPWGAAVADASHAVLQVGGVDVPGSRSPAGDGKWQNADLAGNVAEWVLDTNDSYANPCIDCANVTWPAGTKVARGGAFDQGPSELLVSRRDARDPLHGFSEVGVRCAR